MKVILRLAFLTLLFLVGSISAADRPDFSGSYTLTKFVGGIQPTKPTKGAVWTLEVIQSATTITVTMVRGGRSLNNTFPLDGTEGVYNELNGIVGKCKGHYKGKELYLDSFITTKAESGALRVAGHTTERWKLSPDSKTLTIYREVRTKNADTGQFIGNNIKPWSGTYQRN